MTAPLRFDLPVLGFGMGLRTRHFPHILARHPKIDFFEIISENFMGTGGRPMKVLDQVAERYPIVMHGVSLSIGCTDPLDLDYLRELKRLAARCRAAWVGDHVCWTGVQGRNLHDLLPLPYTSRSLRHVVKRIRRVQDFLERPLILENPSSYAAFRGDEMPEWEFIARMAEEADCGLLLDINNVYVSSVNHGFDAETYVRSIPHDRVVYHHLAGHTRFPTHLLDTHSGPAISPVWDLYRLSMSISGGRTTCFEWDEDLPGFERVHAEVRKASRIAREMGLRLARSAGEERSA